jgi:hypothetical protein
VNFDALLSFFNLLTMKPTMMAWQRYTDRTDNVERTYLQDVGFQGQLVVHVFFPAHSSQTRLTPQLVAYKTRPQSTFSFIKKRTHYFILLFHSQTPCTT